MTTIAYRDGVLASDSKISDRGCWVGNTRKIFRGPDGAIGGLAGCFGDLGIFRDWLAGGRQGACEFKDDGSEAILVLPDGTVWNVFHGGKVFEVTGSPFYAAGSGFRIAIGAMAAGADAITAINICAEYDDATRLPLHVLTIGDADASSDSSR